MAPPAGNESDLTLIVDGDVRGRVRGGLLVILTLPLFVYTAQVPALIAFSGARFDAPAADEPETSPA